MQIFLENFFLALKRFVWRSNSDGWKYNEYFDESWKERIYVLSTLISKQDKSVFDLGCGKEWLREFLNKEILYIPVDYIKRSEECIICDFNKNEFPNLSADVAFVSGVFEYIKDPSWFFSEIYKKCNSLIISYCATDFYPHIKYRRNLNWVNDFSRNELIFFIEKTGFFLSKDVQSKKHLLFRFEKGEV